jgi:hypothetical protein
VRSSDSSFSNIVDNPVPKLAPSHMDNGSWYIYNEVAEILKLKILLACG